MNTEILQNPVVSAVIIGIGFIIFFLAAIIFIMWIGQSVWGNIAEDLTRRAHNDQKFRDGLRSLFGYKP